MRFTSSAISIRGESEFYWRAIRTQFALKLPLYLWAAILISVMCFLALTISIALSKSAEAPSNAFPEYADFFPGQYWSGAVFHCNRDATSDIKYCFFSQRDGLFSDVGVTIENGKITHSTFSLRQNALIAGDLVALWGRPEVQIVGYIAYLDWKNQKIRAIARTDDGRFDYFLPLSTIAFY